ncbi:hypothetical protein IT157_00990 [bacterium]|jgi:hypothetical protein|nr:hypothetical protein [bacterium]
MAYQITEVLFDWLQKKRLVSAVARRMGVNENTLLSELRPTTNTAKFAADDLLPLFDAIRDVGYGYELVGIVKEYGLRLQGEIEQISGTPDMQAQVFRLVSGIGSIAEHISDRAKHSSEADIVALLNKLRVELLPSLVELEAILADRLENVRQRKRGIGGAPAPDKL